MRNLLTTVSVAGVDEACIRNALESDWSDFEASLTDIDIDGDTISIVNIKNLKDYFRNPFNHKSESWKGKEY